MQAKLYYKLKVDLEMDSMMNIKHTLFMIDPLYFVDTLGTFEDALCDYYNGQVNRHTSIYWGLKLKVLPILRLDGRNSIYADLVAAFVEFPNLEADVDINGSNLHNFQLTEYGKTRLENLNAQAGLIGKKRRRR